MSETPKFTIVFEGDLRRLGFNLFEAETLFGKVIAIGDGDALATIDELESRLRLAGEDW